MNVIKVQVLLFFPGNPRDVLHVKLDDENFSSVSVIRIWEFT